MKDLFHKLAKAVAEWTGSATAFCLALATVVGWALCGPLFDYSENWQLVINTGTTIVTFLMVFLIQNSQNRDSQMLHLKLDELIRSNKHARNKMINLDDLSDQQLQALHREYCELKVEADQKLEQISEVQNRKTRA